MRPMMTRLGPIHQRFAGLRALPGESDQEQPSRPGRAELLGRPTAHASASSRFSALMMYKPPMCSLASTNGPVGGHFVEAGATAHHRGRVGTVQRAAERERVGAVHFLLQGDHPAHAALHLLGGGRRPGHFTLGVVKPTAGTDSSGLLVSAGLPLCLLTNDRGLIRTAREESQYCPRPRLGSRP